MVQVLLAGATGNQGVRTARALVARGAAVRALVRPGTPAAAIEHLRAIGAAPVIAAYDDAPALRRSMEGAAVVVSAVSGLAPVIVDAQTRLLEAAVAAGVPRFIPSDYSIDYTALPAGRNRNFDLRRTFRARLNAAPIRATSIFNGAFADMLAGEMPLIVRPLRRVLYWGSADQPFALTTRDDTAAFTAAAALDEQAPRDLHIAGTEATARSIAALMRELSGRRYRPLRAGSVNGLERLSRLVRRVAPQKQAVFPAWQGMQYMRDMFDGRAPSAPIDNDRYPDMSWTDLREVLRAGA
ncbi:NmrA family NAD(P)-binding protein [Sphingomonas aracearum]|uniref:NmrA family protein n=1 Tax=Sphingomonas aracearum TaxID=2283317 RepID=A0A369VTW3_9SPHN|nr:NmrA family NAD(P)-binding protein [Sphingomonas aracearum]RDE05826.1 NmrA family protein [Sphingomonas aracearum]